MMPVSSIFVYVSELFMHCVYCLHQAQDRGTTAPLYLQVITRCGYSDLSYLTTVDLNAIYYH